MRTALCLRFHGRSAHKFCGSHSLVYARTHALAFADHLWIVYLCTHCTGSPLLDGSHRFRLHTRLDHVYTSLHFTFTPRFWISFLVFVCTRLRTLDRTDHSRTCFAFSFFLLVLHSCHGSRTWIGSGLRGLRTVADRFYTTHTLDLARSAVCRSDHARSGSTLTDLCVYTPARSFGFHSYGQ